MADPCCVKPACSYHLWVPKGVGTLKSHEGCEVPVEVSAHPERTTRDQSSLTWKTLISSGGGLTGFILKTDSGWQCLLEVQCTLTGGSVISFGARMAMPWHLYHVSSSLWGLSYHRNWVCFAAMCWKMVTRRADSTPKSVTSSVWSLSAFIVTLRVDQMITKIAFILKSCPLIAHPLHLKTGMGVGGRGIPSPVL